jgi:hypothetical protein
MVVGCRFDTSAFSTPQIYSIGLAWNRPSKFPQKQFIRMPYEVITLILQLMAIYDTLQIHFLCSIDSLHFGFLPHLNFRAFFFSWSHFTTQKSNLFFIYLWIDVKIWLIKVYFSINKLFIAIILNSIALVRRKNGFFDFYCGFFKVADKVLYDSPTPLTPEYPQNYRASILHNPTKYGLNRPRAPRVREHFHLLGTFCHAPVSYFFIWKYFKHNL